MASQAQGAIERASERTLECLRGARGDGNAAIGRQVGDPVSARRSVSRVLATGTFELDRRLSIVLNGVYCVRRRPARPCAELYADLGAALASRAHFPTDIDMGLDQESEHVPSSDGRLVIGDQVVRSRLEIVRETHRRELGRAVLDAERDCPESLDGQRLQPIFQFPIHARKSKAPNEAGRARAVVSRIDAALGRTPPELEDVAT
jgi:hypothetical protein